MDINLSKMTTESRNPSSLNLDIMSPLEIVSIMNEEDRKVPLAIEPHLSQIAQVV